MPRTLLQDRLLKLQMTLAWCQDRFACKALVPQITVLLWAICSEVLPQPRLAQLGILFSCCLIRLTSAQGISVFCGMMLLLKAPRG